MPDADRPVILVLAGVNGAGKSSVAGALLAEHGLTWFNPDTMARDMVGEAGMPVAEANARAWAYGASKLKDAIEQGLTFAFETTLGGDTIRALLAEAAVTHDVVMLYCGLASVELHLERVALRVAHGGHDIPEAKIRERWITSRANLIRLLPHLAHLQVFDNSVSAAPGTPIPAPRLILEVERGTVITPSPDDRDALSAVPDWAKPIVQAALDSASARPPPL